MSIRRIVPNIVSALPDMGREFYHEFLGLQIAMDMGWIVTYASAENPTAQISVLRGEQTSTGEQAVSLSIEVGDVHALHASAVRRGYKIVYPLTQEPWGVLRFHVADPHGIVVNVMCHAPSASR